MKKVPPCSIIRIIELLRDPGSSSRKVAKIMKVGRETVNRIRREYLPDEIVPKGGRPRMFSPRYRRKLIRLLTSGKLDTATQVKKFLECNTEITTSAQTVRNLLHSSGLKSAVKKKKPRLLLHHKRARQNFAIKYRNWTKEDWHKVIFSDETKINRLGSDGRQWVWKKPGIRLNDRQISPTVKFGGGSIMLWGCITVHGIGFMCRIEGRMDSDLYTTILSDEFMNTVNFYNLNKADIIFQQDNDPKHTSKLATKWFEDNDIEVLDWPAQSPDLNPIEHIWWILKSKLAEYEEEPTTIVELWRRIEEEWEKIPTNICREFIESMPRRIAAVYKARGGYTKY